MSDKQPKALRLADEFEATKSYLGAKAAAELRRLHEVNAELMEALQAVIRGVPDTWEGVVRAKAVLRKAQGDNNANG